MTTDDLARLRSLAEAATPGPWQSLVHGTASQRDAAGRAYEAVMAVRVPDSPDIQFTDLSWVDRDSDGPHIALIGNGPNSPENAHYIAALDPQTVLALLDAAEASERLRTEMERIANQADGWEGDEAMERDPWDRRADRVRLSQPTRSAA